MAELRLVTHVLGREIKEIWHACLKAAQRIARAKSG
jgi:hypothetical protein